MMPPYVQVIEAAAKIHEGDTPGPGELQLHCRPEAWRLAGCMPNGLHEMTHNDHMVHDAST